MTDHKRGTTPRFECECRDYDGKYFDPDTHSAKIFNAADELQKEVTNPSKDTSDPNNPLFYFYWTIPVDAAVGTWKLQWQCVKSTYTTIEDKTFKVIE